MSTLTWVSLALAAFAVLAGLSVLVVTARDNVRARGVVEVTEIGPGRLSIRTPYGRGTARTVVHDEHGKVYEVALDLRGENGPTFTYVPPATAMVRSHVMRRVDALRPAPNHPQEPQ